MANTLTVDETRLRFQWQWTITELEEGDKDGSIENVPMQVGDRLFLFFISDREVCFHRRSKGGFSNDRSWEEARGIFNPKTGRITGDIVSDKGFRTLFSIELTIDPRTGEGCIRGTHSHNPTDGHWGGNDRN